MKLRLNNISVDCVIGELPEERVKTQRLRVDAELEIPDWIVASDELSDTVDYAVLKNKIVAALVAAKCRMIERAAWVVRETCLADPKVSSARVTVTKYGAVPGLESASVEL